MSDSTSIDAATKRLTQALDALDAAVERRLEAERGAAQLADQVHTLGTDRARLASELDSQTARSRQLETTNREIARRLDAAIDNIRSVIAARERE
jgi:predicted  nucleic acid-binding Zn-ribbon protein